ncbi:DUF4293 domain-containing protein [Tenacibaculum sp. C7A-26P2]|uniref:DUF4293 domain-containing protein n=1 Tax=Tenacibaculum sp. C7A-26P2 TaxID=3447504 RepID=UPI003F84B404
MIQRLQTIYLLIATILSALSPIFLKRFEAGKVNHARTLLENQSFTESLVPILFLVSALIMCITIFLFKNRKHQILLCQISIMINIFLLGLLIYLSQILSGELNGSKKDIGMFIPLFVILLLYLAKKAIKKDEDLVKSVDRLR